MAAFEFWALLYLVLYISYIYVMIFWKLFVKYNDDGVLHGAWLVRTVAYDSRANYLLELEGAPRIF